MNAWGIGSSTVVRGAALAIHRALAATSPALGTRAYRSAFPSFVPAAELAERRAGLHLALPDVASDEHEELFERHLAVLAEVKELQRRLDAMRPAALRRFVMRRARVAFTDAAHEIIASGRPIVVVGPHLGHYTIGALAMAHVFRDFDRSYGVFFNPPLTNPFSPVMLRLFERLDAAAVPLLNNRAGLVTAFKMLRRKAVVAIMPDFAQPSESMMYVPFFGHYCAAMPGAATMALRFDAAVLPGACRALEGDEFVFTIGDPIEAHLSGSADDNRYALTAAIFADLERTIRADPAQWMFWATYRDLARARLPRSGVEMAHHLAWIPSLVEGLDQNGASLVAEVASAVSNASPAAP